MNINVEHKVREIKLKDNEYLFPLFEGIINSIQAIHAKGEQNGKIEIYIERNKDVQLDFNGSKDKLAPIENITIIDNGIGFDEENYHSFNTAYSDYKYRTYKLGCKGIGRFLALVVFNNVHIESTFSSKEDKKLYKRVFDFNLKNEVDSRDLILSELKHTQTTIRLEKMKGQFQKTTSSSNIAVQVLEHCLIYFISSTAPRIVIHDSLQESPINLNDLFKETIQREEFIDELELKEEKFDLNYVRNYLSRKSHQLHYCANDREVLTKNISTIIPNLSQKLTDEKGDGYYLSVYVTANYLNKNVNEFRSTFSIPSRDTEKQLYDKLSFQEIETEIVKKISEQLQDEIQGVSVWKKKDIEHFVYAKRNYQYRHLLGHDSYLDNIPLSSLTSDEKLDLALHEINYKLEQNQITRVNKFLSNGFNHITESEDYRKELESLIAQDQEFGQAKLASYVMQRKTILKVFDRYLQLQDNGEYKYEEDLHNIIFPKGTNSDTMPYKNHNLWLLDEKLTHHSLVNYYISSDEKYNESPLVESESGEKSDLTVFNKGFAYSESASSVIIFEFKRPMRVFYKDERYLERQIIRYAERLMEARSTNYMGTYTKITNTTPKFGYIICDYDAELETHLLTVQSYLKTPNGGFFKYHPGINFYIEILNYRQLLDNAESRHKAFFRELGVDGI